MKVGSLFSGGGLGDFGFMAAGMEIAWQCEIDDYCQKILALRYPESKKYRDIKTLKGAELEPADIVAGGFPCQPFSVAGNQRGNKDDRYLWPEMLRIIQEVKPTWVVGENVPGIIQISLDDVLSDLEAQGYECGSFVFSAHSLGASHRRDRLWIICYSEHARQLAAKKRESSEKGDDNISSGAKEAGKFTRPSEQYAPLADTTQSGLQGHSRHENKTKVGFVSSTSSDIPLWRNFWESEPDVGRVANGITNRIHRLKMLGNGQCPVNTFLIGKFILEIEREYETSLYIK